MEWLLVNENEARRCLKIPAEVDSSRRVLVPSIKYKAACSSSNEAQEFKLILLSYGAVVNKWTNEGQNDKLRFYKCGASMSKIVRI